MRIKHENISLIESWLLQTQEVLSFDDEFVRKVYDEVLEQRYELKSIENIKRRDRAYRLQYDFVRRDLLKILYKTNNFSASGIKAGFVYAIGNPAWCDFVKIGSAIDVMDRLNSYQTSSPHRDYFLIDYYFAQDRLKEESQVHSLFDRNSEWCRCNIDDIKSFFNQRKRDMQVPVTQQKLFEVKVKKEVERESQRLQTRTTKRTKR